MTPRLSRRTFLRVAGISAIGLIAAGLGGCVYAREVEPGWVDVERVEVSMPRISRAFDGYRIVQIGDLHADGWMTPERVSDAVGLVNDERPDLVAFTGDLVTADDCSDVLHVAGVDDVMEGRDRLGEVLDGLPGDGGEAPIRGLRGWGMIQHTNRGLGVIRPRLRFGCRPGITTFVLRDEGG